MQNLLRRGFDLGPAPALISTKPNLSTDAKSNWQQGLPTKLTGVCGAYISSHADHIADTEKLVLEILEGGSAEEMLDQPPYIDRFRSTFEPMGATFNEGDEQEVETVMFDTAPEHSISARDLWMKVSWLSFHDEDASIRFRFSFGVDLEEDVAADPVRQKAAAELAEAVFPESAIITENTSLLRTIKELLNAPPLVTESTPVTENSPEFVERILYFNAPNGGAYLHHDLERGHAGVVYAQISGSTLWLALPQHQLVNEISEFVSSQTLPHSCSEDATQELYNLARDKESLSAALNSFANDALIQLINETEPFVQHLIAQGHYQILEAGDVILLPQQGVKTCCWHSVFCLGEEMGQALSFAIR